MYLYICIYVYVYVDTRSHLGSRCSSCLLAQLSTGVAADLRPSASLSLAEFIIASPFALAG